MLTTQSFNNVKTGLCIQEGYRKMPFFDTQKRLTVGIGFNLDSGLYPPEDVARYKKEGISLEESLKILSNEIRALDFELSKNSIYRTLWNDRQSVIIDMAYNMGIKGVYGFHEMWNALSVGNYEKAAHEMLFNRDGSKTPYYSEVGKRALNLSRIMQTGIWS